MDNTYENNDLENENINENTETLQVESEPVFEQPEQPAAEAQPQKASPFADSPYVINSAVQEAKPVKKEKKCKRTFWKRALCAVLALVLVAGSCIATAVVVSERWEDKLDAAWDAFEDRIDQIEDGRAGSQNTIQPGGNTVTSTSGILTPAQVYAQNVDSVVMIYSKVAVQEGGQVLYGTSTGSGFIITEDGYAVTNYHVVQGATSVSVTMNDGAEYAAEIVGYDNINDVALLKIDATGLPYVPIGSSADLIVGDQVVAIGNPLGELTSTLTVGYISAKERDVTTDGSVINMLQTDAAINSGNSGGPLFNMKGEVVGITTAKYSGTTSSGASIEGIGFAIPIDDVYDLLSDLITYGYVTGAYLGVYVSDMNAEAAAYYGMPVGAYVEETTKGCCAEAAGVKGKDIIVALGEHEVGSVSELTRVLRKFEAGDTTTITVYRGGQEIVLPITLDAKPAEGTQSQVTPTFPEETPEGDFDEWYDYFAPFFGKGND